jgi:DNA-binding LacI/PurR family transcriptional regulator
MRAIREAGLDVPDDIALVGFDDLRYASDLDLTTVAQPAFETGRTAAEILIGEIDIAGHDGLGERFHQVVLPTQLVVRGSCGGQRS